MKDIGNILLSIMERQQCDVATALIYLKGDKDVPEPICVSEPLPEPAATDYNAGNKGTRSKRS